MKQPIAGNQYKVFLKVAGKINNYLKQNGLHDSDLFLVDYFLYAVTTAAPPKLKEGVELEQIEHDDLVGSIREIGEWLGFQCETNHTIAKGSQVDVV